MKDNDICHIAVLFEIDKSLDLYSSYDYVRMMISLTHPYYIANCLNGYIYRWYSYIDSDVRHVLVYYTTIQNHKLLYVPIKVETTIQLATAIITVVIYCVWYYTLFWYIGLQTLLLEIYYILYTCYDILHYFCIFTLFLH